MIKLFASILVALVILPCLFNLFPYLAFDAASFYYAAMQIAEGGRPYLAFIDNKNPLIYYLLALPAYFFSWNVSGALILFRIIDILQLAALWFLLRCFCDSKGALLFAVLSYWVAYLSCFVTSFESIYSEMPQTLAMLIAFIFVAKQRSLILAGIFCGVSFLFRQPGVVHTLMLIAYLALVSLPNIKRSLMDVLKLLLGFFLPVFSMVFVSYTQGWLTAWWEQAFVWSYQYAASYPPFYTRLSSQFLQIFQNDFLLFFGFAFLLWLVTLCRDLQSADRQKLPCHLFILCTLIAGLIDTALPANFWRHQLIPWLPSLSLMLCAALETIYRRFESRPKTSHALAAVFVACLLVPAYNICLDLLRREDFVQERIVTRDLAKWIRANSLAHDQILVWGFIPQLYLEAKRQAASSHYHNLLLDNFGGAFKFSKWNEEVLKTDLIKTPPKLIMLYKGISLETFIPDLMNSYSKEIVKVGDNDFVFLKRNA